MSRTNFLLNQNKTKPSTTTATGVVCYVRDSNNWAICRAIKNELVADWGRKVMKNMDDVILDISGAVITDIRLVRYSNTKVGVFYMRGGELFRNSLSIGE